MSKMASSVPTIVAQPGQAVIIQVPQFGLDPVKMSCSRCNASITTTIKPCKGALAWTAFCFLCACGCWCGCCMIPFQGTKFMDIEHYCPLCDQKLGAFIRL